MKCPKFNCLFSKLLSEIKTELGSESKKQTIYDLGPSVYVIPRGTANFLCVDGLILVVIPLIGTSCVCIFFHR